MGHIYHHRFLYTCKIGLGVENTIQHKMCQLSWTLTLSLHMCWLDGKDQFKIILCSKMHYHDPRAQEFQKVLVNSFYISYFGFKNDQLVLVNPIASHYFLANVDYVARSSILHPYQGVGYHFKEFQGTRRPKNPRELLNLRHSSLRTTIEWAFGTLKNR